ncbi:MAG: aspartate ammonia-lyase [Candidatus Marinimicrobia bacterium]|nr:aspartate ammonia-lyase [Candidatus Neomarinimicrobiota bacterium]
MRIEKDTMGEISLPDECYYGAQTQRAFDNFQISSTKIPRSMIAAIAMIKRSAAIVNNNLNFIDTKIKDAIVKACDEVIQGKFDDQFIVDIYQTGSGTSSNMNANEVIANRACEILGGNKGDKKLVHPNDHVNYGQSSNDVIPTSIHIATSLEIDKRLLPELENLKISIDKKTDEFKDIIKIGRTHLQDATPITLGQEFSGYSKMIENSIQRIKNDLPFLLKLAQGGTAVGTGINTHKDFGKLVAHELSVITGLNFTESDNHFESQATQDSVVHLSGSLKTLSVSLYKIANDIRWLGSGPRSGLGELVLPPVQPGSSIMPGKVNPVICESLIQVTSQVVGYDSAIALGGMGGVFELNLMLPLIGSNILESINILSNGMKMFREKLLNDLSANKNKCNGYIEDSLAMCTSLAPIIGYDKAASIAKKAFKNDKTVREVCIEDKILSNEELEKILDPFSMIQPNDDNKK